MNRVLTLNRVPQGQRVNKDYYEYFFSPTIHCKRPELLEATPLILQDNTMCHKASNVHPYLQNTTSKFYKPSLFVGLNTL